MKKFSEWLVENVETNEIRTHIWQALFDLTDTLDMPQKQNLPGEPPFNLEQIKQKLNQLTWSSVEKLKNHLHNLRKILDSDYKSYPYKWWSIVGYIANEINKIVENSNESQVSSWENWALINDFYEQLQTWKMAAQRKAKEFDT